MSIPTLQPLIMKFFNLMKKISMTIYLSLAHFHGISVKKFNDLIEPETLPKNSFTTSSLRLYKYYVQDFDLPCKEHQNFGSKKIEYIFIILFHFIYYQLKYFNSYNSFDFSSMFTS